MIAISGTRQEPKGGGKHQAASKARTVAAVGVVASVGVGAFGAAEAQASGKIFACYSKSTKIVEHATSKHCASGFKSLSWNKTGVKGPQGAQGAAGGAGVQGAQGAQGAPGLVAGYMASTASPPTFAVNTRETMATITPAAAGNYEVNGTVTFRQAGHTALLKCGLGNGTTSTLVQEEHLSNTGAVPVTGIIHGGPASPIAMACSALSNSGHPFHAVMDAVQVATVNGHATAESRQPNNRFQR